jgi:hypothetical protein
MPGELNHIKFIEEFSQVAVSIAKYKMQLNTYMQLCKQNHPKKRTAITFNVCYGHEMLPTSTPSPVENPRKLKEKSRQKPTLCRVFAALGFLKGRYP